MDPDANRENPYSPGSYLGVNEQLLYKVAGLEQSVSNMAKRLDEKFDRVISELNNKHTDIIKDLSTLESKVDQNRREIIDLHNTNKAEVEKLKEWKTSIVSRISAVGGVILIVWTIFSDALKHMIGIM